MTIISAIFQGILQGLTEFLPVSSSGHLSLWQYFTGVNSETSVSFSVMLHLGTLLAVIIAFWPTVRQLLREFFLLFADPAEVMQERPAVDIKRVLHVLQQRTFTSVRDMIVNTRVASFRIRNTNGDFILTLPCWDSRNRRFDNSELYKF